MTKSPTCFTAKNLSLLFFVVFSFSNVVLAKDTKEIVNAKANFILEVAYNIYYSDPSESEKFQIAVYGRDVEAKAIYAKLSHLTKDLEIDEKAVEIQLYKYMRTVKPVDVVFVSAKAKIRLGDLHDKLSSQPYSLITENYPFGTSSINMSLDKNDDLIFEIQPATLRKNGATIRRKLLENRNRITSADQWKAAAEQSGSSNDYRNKSTAANVQDDGKLFDTLIAEESIEKEGMATDHNVLEDCQSNTEKALANAERKFNWLLGISLFIILALTYYITRLKRQ